jgi:dTDP-4-dehydrorhamnose reductase
MKLLLTGKNGQLGFELQRALAPLGELIAVDATECDLTDTAAIQTLLEREDPAVIVNPAAYTAVDRAESEPELAAAVNTEAPRQFGAWAAATGALVLHYSTDYVFDGTKAGPYVEEDVTAPLGVYGLTKRDGESALRQTRPRHLILRTSWVVGAHGGNFAKTMLRLAAERDSLRVVNDQWGAPTSAALLADLTAHLVRQWAQRDPSSGDAFPYGTYHVANAGETNWYDYARFVLAAAHESGRSLRVTSDQIEAITTADYPTPAARPANSRLDCRRFRNTFGLHLPPWQQSLRHLLAQILETR